MLWAQASGVSPLGPWWVQALGTMGAFGVVTFLWLKIGRPGLADANQRSKFWEDFAGSVDKAWEARFAGLVAQVEEAKAEAREAKADAREAIERADACEAREAHLREYLRSQDIEVPPPP